MSAPAIVTIQTEPSLSESVCTMLRVLTRGARAEDSLLVSARGGTARLGSAETSVHAGDVSEAWLPATVLRVLEEEAGTPWSVHLSAMHGTNGRDPATLSALAAAWTIQRVYRNPDWRRPADYPHGKRHIWPEDRIQAIVAQLEGSALPPSLILDAMPTLVAVWALDGALPVKGATEAARVMLLLRALAATVGAVVPPKEMALGDVVIPLPGVAAQSQQANVVTCISLNPSRVYRIEDVEAAIAAKE